MTEETRNPNILLVILDSVRAANTSLLGYERETTPFLEDFAEQSTVYTQARAPGIHSIASHVSIFTGHEVEEHRCTDHTAKIDTSKTIWSKLSRKNGYRTGLFTPNVIVSTTSNLANSFDTVKTREFVKSRDPLFEAAFDPVDVARHEGVKGNINRAIKNNRPIRSLVNCAWRFLDDKRTQGENGEETGERYIEQFKQWVSTIDNSWAACINLMDPHYPYTPDPQFDRWAVPEIHDLQDNIPGESKAAYFLEEEAWDELAALKDLYDGGIRQADQLVQRLIDFLADINSLEQTLVVITSDHGEGFGEQSHLEEDVRIVAHNWGIHECLTHVPLIVKLPGQSDGDQVNEVATLSQFPSCVKGVLTNDPSKEFFVPESGHVLTSTYRLLEEDSYRFRSRDMSPYLGPWRAVYHSQGDITRRYMSRENRANIVEISDPHTVDLVDSGGAEKVKTAFSQLRPADILDAESDEELSVEVREHLDDLGYL